MEEFQWTRHPKSEKLIEDILSQCIRGSSFVHHLSEDMKLKTSTRLLDWVDHVAIAHSKEAVDKIEKLGFEEERNFSWGTSYRHLGAQLPTIVLDKTSKNRMDVAVAVDSIADFLMVRGLDRDIEGSPLSPFRRSLVLEEGNIRLWAVERRGTRTLEPTYEEGEYAEMYITVLEKWQTRTRHSENEADEIETAIYLADEFSSIMGQDVAAWIVCEGERKYWEARNRAGQIQKNRQDRLGLGWANHDHHTFRSSRRHFQSLVQLFEILGFTKRERFYAGEEAGWGAQVMENSNAGLVLFLDVDLAPEEVKIDFANQHLEEKDRLGTIGLWCELHGDSILKAGMHHLEGQFLFENLKSDLDQYEVGMMQPFSDFSYLKQAFTQGEIWKVDPKRVERLLNAGQISKEDADKFLTKGAVGSHLENLQRREGYKGFNQNNVSFIIGETDPRKLGV